MVQLLGHRALLVTVVVQDALDVVAVTIESKLDSYLVEDVVLHKNKSDTIHDVVTKKY